MCGMRVHGYARRGGYFGAGMATARSTCVMEQGGEGALQLAHCSWRIGSALGVDGVHGEGAKG